MDLPQKCDCNDPMIFAYLKEIHNLHVQLSSVLLWDVSRPFAWTFAGLHQFSLESSIRQRPRSLLKQSQKGVESSDARKLTYRQLLDVIDTGINFD